MHRETYRGDNQGDFKVDFSGVTNDTSSLVAAAVDMILSLDISPADKQSRIAALPYNVGEHYHTQLYDATSAVFDSTAIKSTGFNDMKDQTERLALKIVRNYALSRDTVTELVAAYYDSVLGKAQGEAFDNARSMQKHPMLTRSLVGEKNCDWCATKAAASPYINPTNEDFSRHHLCDCLFVVSGYNSRNGVLKNYVKKG